MLVKNLTILMGSLLSLSLWTVSAVPSLAESNEQQLQSQLQESRKDDTNYLLSQLRGHDTYKGEPQLEVSDYLLGTVVGQAGDIFTVRLKDGKSFHGTIANSYLYRRVNKVGANVLVVEEDGKYGKYRIVDFAHPQWIEELEQDYGLRR